MHTLSDEIPAPDREPEEEREPESDPPGLTSKLREAIDRLTHRASTRR